MKLIITDLQDLPFRVEGEHQVIGPGGGPLHPCTGCFGCWVRTPGRCVIPDGYQNTGIAMSRCDRLILVSRCCYGSLSPFVKGVLDRAISYVHPDFVFRDGEMHHKRRYQDRFTLSAWFYGEDITRAEQETALGIIAANALNYDTAVGEVRFFPSPEGMKEVAL